MKMRLLLSLLLLVSCSTMVQAELILSGSSVEFVGNGNYVFEYYATASGEDIALAGFEVPIAFADGVTYVNNSYAPTFLNQAPTVTPNPAAGLFPTADILLTGLNLFPFNNVPTQNIADGETVTLFSYILNLDTNAGFVPGVVATIVNENNSLGFNNSVGNPFTFNPAIGSQTATAQVTAVPEPASALLLISGGLGLGALGWRRKARKVAAATEEQQS